MDRDSCSISPGSHVNQLRMNFTIASGLHGDCGLCRDFDRKGVGGMERVSAVIDCVPRRRMCCGIGGLVLEPAKSGWMSVEIGDWPKIAALV